MKIVVSYLNIYYDTDAIVVRPRNVTVGDVKSYNIIPEGGVYWLRIETETERKMIRLSEIESYVEIR